MECAPYGKVRKDIDGCRGEINGRTEMSRWDFFFERVGCGANYGLTLVVVGSALFLRVLRRSFWLWLQCVSFTARAVPKFVLLRHRLARFDRCGIQRRFASYAIDIDNRAVGPALAGRGPRTDVSFALTRVAARRRSTMCKDTSPADRAKCAYATLWLYKKWS